MKKYKKVIAIVIAFIIGISTTVGAATVFNSKDITYSSSATTKKNVKDSLDELYGKVGKCPDGYTCYKKQPISIVNVGDYISMTPTSTSYTLSNSLSGCTGASSTCVQNTINPSELNLWRVIRINTDGTVEMVSDKVSSKKVYFYGETGYINFVKGLNTIAAQYTDGVHVSSTRHIGYSNQTQTITSTSKLTQTSAPWTKETDDSSWTSCLSYEYLCGTDEALGAGDRGFTTDYELVNGVYGSMAAKNPSDEVSSYWVASRHYSYSAAKSWEFNFSTTDTRGDLRRGASPISHHPTYGYQYGAIGDAVRPVVILRSDTMISFGKGSSSSPYFLT